MVVRSKWVIVEVSCVILLHPEFKMVFGFYVHEFLFFSHKLKTFRYQTVNSWKAIRESKFRSNSKNKKKEEEGFMKHLRKLMHKNNRLRNIIWYKDVCIKPISAKKRVVSFHFMSCTELGFLANFMNNITSIYLR